MAFEQIMAEVIVATRVNGNVNSNNNNTSSGCNPNLGPGPGRPVSVVQSQVRSSEQHHLHINQSVANCRAESLPNVNYSSGNGGGSMCQNSSGAIDLQSALNNLEEMRRGTSPAKDRHRRASPGRSSQQGHRRSDITSPYATPYLSPPDPWRRTNSDSAIHQSSLLPSSPSTSRRSPIHVGSLHGLDSSQCQSSGWADPGGRGPRHYMSQQNPGQLLSPSQQELRPKSCEVPNITVNLTQDDPGVHHIPLTGNTGSLPDLTSFHFPAPLSTPIDPAEDSVSASNSQSSQYQTQSNSNCGSPFSTSLHPGSMTYSPPPPDMMTVHQPMNHQGSNLIGDPMNGATMLQSSSDPKSSSSCVPVIEIYPSQEEINNCITASLGSDSIGTFQQQQTSSSSTGVDDQEQQQQDVTPNGHWSQYQSSPASPFLGAATDSPYSNCGSPFSPQSNCSALGYSPSSPETIPGSNADHHSAANHNNTTTNNSQQSLIQNDEAFRRINLYEDDIDLHEDSTCEVN